MIRAWSLAAVLAVACAPPDRMPRQAPERAGSPRAGGALRAATSFTVVTLDPTIGYDETTFTALHPLFDTLVDFAPAGTAIVPRLAARWTISSDGRTYDFELRPGITYADGAPITAAHVKYGLERALATPDSPGATHLRDIEGAALVRAGHATTCAGIVADGDRRLVIRLAQPFPAFLGVLTMPFATPQRPGHVAQAGDQLRRRPDASGPFELVSWDEGHQLVLRKNPRYHDPARAGVDTIVLHENVSRDLQFQMFERGELEIVEQLAGQDYLFVTSEPAWQPYVHRTLGLNAYGSRINVRREPFDDRRVRQALNYAVDRRRTARLVAGATIPAHGILPPGMFGRDPELAPYPRDVARARALLAEAGYPDGIDVEYAIPTDEEIERIAVSLQHDLGEARIRVRLSVMAWSTFTTAIARPDGPALSYISWVADYPDPSNFLDPKFRSAASSNDSFYANPALDQLLDAARRELDAGRRRALYHQAERILHDDAPWIWNYHGTTTSVTQPYVRNYQPHPIWLHDYTSVWIDSDPGRDGQPVQR